jgi:hypothetical protein
MSTETSGYFNSLFGTIFGHAEAPVFGKANGLPRMHFLLGLTDKVIDPKNLGNGA